MNDPTLDENCLSHWFPVIEANGIPVPKTVTIDVGDKWHEMGLVLDGQESEVFNRLVKTIEEVADHWEYPLFLRTGHTSGKHRWLNTCFLQGREAVARNAWNLIEQSEMAGILGLPYRIWAVREMLPVDPLFVCRAYHRMPVLREFRAFVEGHKVLYVIPYWPEDAIEKGRPDVTGWRGILQGASCLQDAERHAIERLASRVGAAMRGRWSVDVVWTRRGWVVTDMANAEQSWGWDEEKIRGESCG